MGKLKIFRRTENGANFFCFKSLPSEKGFEYRVLIVAHWLNSLSYKTRWFFRITCSINNSCRYNTNLRLGFQSEWNFHKHAIRFLVAAHFWASSRYRDSLDLRTSETVGRRLVFNGRYYLKDMNNLIDQGFVDEGKRFLFFQVFQEKLEQLKAELLPVSLLIIHLHIPTIKPARRFFEKALR